jgi:hypothetical protein
MTQEEAAELGGRYLALHRSGLPTPEVRERMGITAAHDLAIRRRLHLLYRFPPRGDAKFRYPRLVVLTAELVARMERRKAERAGRAAVAAEAEEIRRVAEWVRSITVRAATLAATVEAPMRPRILPSVSALRAAWWGSDPWDRIEAAGLGMRMAAVGGPAR